MKDRRPTIRTFSAPRTRKDHRSAALAEQGEVARSDEKFNLRMEDRDFQRGATTRV
jgi:hypothetical protein